MKKREPADAFGLSLLDVLSNALGGVILLMLIVVLTIKGNDKKRLNLSQEERPGEWYTVLDFEKKKPEVQFNLLLAQISLLGAKEDGQFGELELTENTQYCGISKENSERKNAEWFILRHGVKKEKWEVKFKEPYEGVYPDSIAVVITIDEKICCSKIVKVTDVNEPLLTVQERGEKQPEITISGNKKCPY